MPLRLLILLAKIRAAILNDLSNWLICVILGYLLGVLAHYLFR